MRRFIFGGSKVDWPPGKRSGDRTGEEAASTPEFVMQERPANVNEEDVIKMAHDGDFRGIAAKLEENYDDWTRYAQHRNYFVMGEHSATRTLHQAKMEILKLAQEFMAQNNEFKRDGKEMMLRRKLEEYSGPLTENLVGAVEENWQRFAASAETSHAEQRQELEGGISEIQALSGQEAELASGPDEDTLELTHIHARDAAALESDDNILELTKDQQIQEGEPQPAETSELLLTRKHNERHIEREAKADKFAEKYELTEYRNDLLDAEEAYAEAIRKRKSKFFHLKFRDEAATSIERENLESAINNWRGALAKAGEKATESGEKGDALSAKFISARDTMMRMEEVRQDAVKEGLDAQSKSVLGRMDTWANKLNKKVLNVAMGIGSLFGKASEKTGSLVAGKVIDKFIKEDKDSAEYREKYQRASRIIGGALLSSALGAAAGAVTAGVAGIPLILRFARGLGMGFGGGAYIGKKATERYTKAHEKKHGVKEERLEEHLGTRKELHDVLRGKKGSYEELDPEWLREAFKKSDKEAFEKREAEHELWKKRIEVATPILVGGALSFGAAHWPSVHEAGAVMKFDVGDSLNHPPDAVIPGGPVNVSDAGLRHEFQHIGEAGAPAPAVHVEPVAVGGNVNDADRLLGRFVDNIRHQFPNPQDAPPALRTLLEQTHAAGGQHEQDVLTRFLHLQNGGSVTVQPGDTVSYENGKVMFQGHELISQDGTVHNLQTSNEIHMQHEPGAQTATPEAARPEAPVQSQAAQQPQPQPVQQPVTTQPQPTAATATPPQGTSPTGLGVVPQEIHTQPAPQPEIKPESTPVAPLEQNPTPIPAAEQPPAPVVNHQPSVEASPPAESVEQLPSSPVRSPVSIPEAANDVAPVVTEAPPIADHPAEVNHPPVTHEGPAQMHQPVLNRNGFDLANPNVGLDRNGNAFSHIIRTDNLTQNNELAYQKAYEFASTHHDRPVYYINETRTALGEPQYKVFALRFNPDSNNWNYFPNPNDPYQMPPIPNDADLRNIR